MPDTIPMLRFEHEHAAGVLGVLEEELRTLAANEPADQVMLESILEYFMGYPEQCHHPVEDAVYRRLQARDPQAAQRIGSLDAEHERLSKMTAKLASLVNAAGAAKDRDELRRALREFIDTYRSHMRNEERYFFPEALRSLTPDDWGSLDYDLFDRADPLFDRRTERRFESLRARILARAETLRHERDALHELERLQALTTIEDFDATSRERGWRLTLRRSNRGGFELVRTGHVVAILPECDERTAAWCAFYFAKGFFAKGFATRNA